MSKTLWRSVLPSIGAGLCTMAWAGAAGAVVNISACGSLGAARETYNVTADLHAVDGADCLVIAANGITVNLQGHAIIQDGAVPVGSGITDGGVALDLIVVKNGSIENFGVGVDLGSTTRVQVLNVAVRDSVVDGIVVGNNSLVKGSTAEGNGFGFILGGDGIRGADVVQVQGSNASSNALNGIRVGQRCLVTQNRAEDNLGDGINTQGQCTVTRNTASNNDDDGIDVGGSGSLVTFNQTNDNFDVGIRVVCRSTITNNQSSGNAANFEFVGAGCVTNQAM
jgi:parallel beta-helix repeat protein